MEPTAFAELRRLLGRPIDVASLAVFRIAAGILLAAELVNDVFIGDFAEYAAPGFHFSYPFLGFVRPWPPAGMALHWAAAIVLALAVAAGAFLRVTGPLLFVAWTSLFLMERSEYVNHTYLYCWITLWLAVLPVGGALSLDAGRRPERATVLVPAWTRGVLLFQMAVVYLFAGLAKLDGDWLRGIPLSMRLPDPSGLRILRPLVEGDAAPVVIAWSGIVFDLGIVPLLLHPRTRRAAFAAAVLFHAGNAALFGLASFPWFSIAATTLFLDPSWPRAIPFLRRRLPPLPPESARPATFAVGRPVVVALALYAALQIALPLRHWLYPGDVAWTEEGHLFAWRMMLRGKTGRIRFHVEDPATGSRRTVDPARHLTPAKAHRLAGEPDMILQFARYLAAEERRRGAGDVRVFADARVRLNGRPPRPLVDPTADLAREGWTLRPWRWIVRPRRRNERRIATERSQRIRFRRTAS